MAAIFNKTSFWPFDKPRSITGADSRWCATVDQATLGEWQDPFWRPNSCELYNYSSREVQQCLSARKIAFFGDSLGRVVVNQLIDILEEKAWNGLSARMWASTSRAKRTKNRWKNTWGDQVIRTRNVSFHTFWNPSAYYQQPRKRQVQKFDALYLSQTVWDMGNYFRGAEHWYAATKRNMQTLRRHARPGTQLLYRVVHRSAASAEEIVQKRLQ